MAKDAKKRVVFISTFPPRKCGIATFTSDLIKNASVAARGEFEPLVVTMQSDDNLRYCDPVRFEIRQNVRSNYYKAKFGLEGHKTILTFGLISRNKGIEVMLRALPRIVEAEPSIMYIVLGMTHPAVLKSEGESYRFSLVQLVKDLGLQDHVIFHNQFVDDEELHNFLCAADLYVTPYLVREQLTSGTLAFAVGAGKAVISTPYWAAAELLADGRGRLVPFGDSDGLTQEIVGVLHNDGLFYSLRRNAYDYGRSRTWPKIGQVYWKLFEKTLPRLPLPISGPSPRLAAETPSNVEIPEPALDHLIRLTDDTGLFQHARFTIPNRAHGYCTDDNARGAIAMVRYYLQYRDPQALRLLDTYLAFLMYAQNPDGSIRNFLDFNRRWWDNEPDHDGFGRALWALGTVLANPPSPAYLSVMKDCFDRATGHVQHQSARGLAYCIFGLCDYLKQFPGASDIKRHVELAAGNLVNRYRQARAPRWDWFENFLTYDNAVLPHALFVAGLKLDHPEFIEVATRATDFLLETMFHGDHFSFIGTQGWLERGKARAAFDQQPVEAAAMVMMLRSAYDATQEPRFLALQRTAFDWFLGTNDLRVPLYDFRTKGCSDGLMASGVNGNQGAESMVSFLLSLLAIVESYAMVDKVHDTESASSLSANLYDETEPESVEMELPAEQGFAKSESGKPA